MSQNPHLGNSHAPTPELRSHTSRAFLLPLQYGADGRAHLGAHVRRRASRAAVDAGPQTHHLRQANVKLGFARTTRQERQALPRLARSDSYDCREGRGCTARQAQNCPSTLIVTLT